MLNLLPMPRVRSCASSSIFCGAKRERYRKEVAILFSVLQQELLVSGESNIAHGELLAYLDPGLSEIEMSDLFYSSKLSQPWPKKYKILMKRSVLVKGVKFNNDFLNPIYYRRLRHASPFALITSLHLSGLSDRVQLLGFHVLHTLTISGCERLNAVSFYEKLSAVEALEISYCPELASLTGLNQLPSLRSLLLSFCSNLQFGSHVQLPPLLEYLDLTSCPSLDEWCRNAGFQNWKVEETLELSQRSSRVGDSPVYGRENEKNSIVESLLSDDFSRNNLNVVCIVGESGIGKTSMAHLIYTEERVLDSFDARILITMPENSDETTLLEKLIESASCSPCPMVEPDILEDLLMDELLDTKVLVILDDAENENPNFWSRILTILNHSSKGSALLVTVKSKDVAEVIGAMQTYYLKALPDYYCWKIFWQHVFTGLSTNTYADLAETGKKLLSKCQHNPLFIKGLAGLLVCSKHEESLVEILKPDLWEIDGFDGVALPTLRVCYQLLPKNLKKCFHYCSLFPKDYIFLKQQIVRMWISQSFIIPVEGRQPEEVGVQYFNELLLRGFFQHSPLHDVKEGRFIMHDLIRALASYSCSNKYSPAKDSLEKIPKSCFHFSLHPSMIQIDKVEPLTEEEDLLSFLALTRFSLQTRTDISILDVTSLNNLFTKCINLRTLDLSCTDIIELPTSVGMLKQLRYFGVNKTKIRNIPRALCSLVSLQTLEARDCQNLVELPENMMELTNLRHLDVSKKSGCVKMMIGIGRLTNLQSLTAFFVGCEIPYCSIRELKDLNFLSDCLQIAGLENVKAGLDAKEAALHNKMHLNTLWLHWSDNRTCTKSEESALISEEVLDNLKPNPKIGELIIRNYLGNLFPTWMGDPCFLKLDSIILDKCINCTQFPALGSLPALRHLSVQKLYHLLRLENSHSQFDSKNTPKFPSLETLNLWEMYNLEELFETSDWDFPRLHTLSIGRCPMLKRVPCFSSLLKLSLYCCVRLPYLPDLPSLRSLRIDGFQQMKSVELPKGLPELRKLEIRYCNELLLVEGIKRLPSLEKLNVVHCPKFDSVKKWKQCHSKPISTTRYLLGGLTACSATAHAVVNSGLGTQAQLTLKMNSPHDSQSGQASPSAAATGTSASGPSSSVSSPNRYESQKRSIDAGQLTLKMNSPHDSQSGQASPSAAATGTSASGLSSSVSSPNRYESQKRSIDAGQSTLKMNSPHDSQSGQASPSAAATGTSASGPSSVSSPNRYESQKRSIDAGPLTLKMNSPHDSQSGQASASAAATGTSASGPSSLVSSPNRYESQKRRDWNTFGQYLRNKRPPLNLAQCGGAHVLEFLRYLDQFGKTKVHTQGCPFFGHPNPPAPCPCPLRQAWGSLDALVGRLRAAYEENGGRPESNPFDDRSVRLYLREVREQQARARGVSYEKKKRKKPQNQQNQPQKKHKKPQNQPEQLSPPPGAS